MSNPYLDAAKKTATLKATEVLEMWRQKFQVKEKGKFDLVTDADLASQKAIQAFLSTRFPEHAFSWRGRGRQSPTGSRCAADLDCRSDRRHYQLRARLPVPCISIGLQIAGELVVGVVYDPPHKEMFAAAKGEGAWLNERRLHVSSTATLGQALLSTGFPPDLRGNEKALDWWRHFAFQTQALRRTGSTALNLAYVAPADSTPFTLSTITSGMLPAASCWCAERGACYEH